MNNKTFFSNLSSLWAELVIEECVRLGISKFCIGCGSRSSALTVAVAQRDDVDVKTFFDERGLAFFALGWSKSVNEIVAIITTSGSAVANLLPAVVESYHSGISILIITADRPPELIDVGANQAIKQRGLFSHFVFAELELMPADLSVSPSSLLKKIDFLVEKAFDGPIHLNMMFRDPFIPSKEKYDFSHYLNPIKGWLNCNKPFKLFKKNRFSYDHSEKLYSFLNDFIQEQGNCRILFVLGNMISLAEQQAIESLLLKLDFPVITDIGSGFRLLKWKNHLYFSERAFDQNDFYDLLSKADVLFQLGSHFVSKSLLNWMEQFPGKTVLAVNQSGNKDPLNRNVFKWEGGISHLLTCLEKYSFKPMDVTWFEELKKIAQRPLVLKDDFSHELVVHALSQSLSSKIALYLANSLPIRMFNSFANPMNDRIFVGSSRGVSGIDGIIASAMGWAYGLKKPTILVIGDLSFMYDLNALYFLKSLKYPLFIVVINNRGGGIFDQLPIKKEQPLLFDRFFKFKHDATFSGIANAFELDYVSCNDLKACRDTFLSFKNRNDSCIVEVDLS